MRFEARELKSYAEPVSATDLKIGAVYFSLHFLDSAMLIPELRPLVFIGKNLEPDDTGIVYFQDYDSYSRSVRYGQPGDPSIQGWFESGSENETNHIFEFERALNVLLSCSLRCEGDNSEQ